MGNNSVLHHDHPQCPNCQSLIVDALLVNINDLTFTCQNCQKEVKVDREVSVKYSTHLLS